MAGRNISFTTILLPDEERFKHSEQKTADRSYGDHTTKLAILTERKGEKPGTGVSDNK